jgi:hypothetical protein
LEEIVTSLTGNASLPSSIQKPEAPREKSPVTALKPKPIISVTYSPRGVAAISSSGVCVPAFMIRLLVLALTPPPERPALAVDSRCSLRAE